MEIKEVVILILYACLEYYLGKTKKVKENSLIEVILVLIVRVVFLYKLKYGREKWKRI